MIAARYDRSLASALVDHLKIGGALEFLLHAAPAPADKPYALDIQLREKNKIMYYMGTTRLLVITLSPRKGTLPTFTAQADKFYRDAPACIHAYGQIAELGRTSPADAKAAFQKYLSSAMTIAPFSHYANQAEGYWQNRLCHRFGFACKAEDQWLVVDRECVIGFENGKDKEAFFVPILEQHRAICERISNAGKEQWRQTIIGKGLGDELDMLAIDPNGTLLAIELKYRTNANGIYWGPVQVGVYAKAFSLQLAVLGPAVVSLVKQKVALGLLPKHALNRLPPGGFKTVLPVLAIAKANPKSGCWSKLIEVMECVGQVEVVTVGDSKEDDIDLPGISSRYIAMDPE